MHIFYFKFFYNFRINVNILERNAFISTDGELNETQPIISCTSKQYHKHGLKFSSNHLIVVFNLLYIEKRFRQNNRSNTTLSLCVICHNLFYLSVQYLRC